MFNSTPVGRNYNDKYYNYLETVKENEKDGRIKKLNSLGFDVRAEKSRSKNNAGWNIFIHNENKAHEYRKEFACSWRIKK